MTLMQAERIFTERLRLCMHMSIDDVNLNITDKPNPKMTL